MEEEWFAGGPDPLPHPMMDLHRKMLVDPPGPLVLRVVRLFPEAVLPSKSFLHDAGWDLAAIQDEELVPREVRGIPTGLEIAVPDGYYAQIRDRSSLAMKGLFVVAGVIDSSYRGLWAVFLYNSTRRHLCIGAGDRVAQFTIHRVPICRIEEVTELPQSARGAGGFGSTGR